MAEPTLLELDDRVLGVHEELVGLLGIGATLDERLRAALALGDHGIRLLQLLLHRNLCKQGLTAWPSLYSLS